MSIVPITCVPRAEIDTSRWDQCVQQSNNNLIYGFSFYLDQMSPGWIGLIVGDYEYVMPLTWRRKFGISYLYQPAFIQQAGLFSKNPVTDQLLKEVLKEIKRRFRFVEICFNYQNPSREFVPRPNFVLSLHRSYEEISAQYKTDLKNNLKLVEKNDLQYSERSLPEALSDFRKLYSSRLSITDRDYKAFARVCDYCHQQGWLLTRTVTDANGATLSSAVLLKKDGRMYLLHSSTFPEGRELSANHFLLDRLIREFSSQPWTLDFEGSAVPGIAHFYSNFGSVNEPYYFWKYNGLPALLRLFKK